MSASAHLDSSCLFCKIIKGEIPSMKLLEDDHVYAFLDIGPIAPKHALVIPKYHGKTVKDIPDEYLAKIVPALKKIAIASGEEDFNLLANAGSIAHQVVNHLHFHFIPKPDEKQGLGVGWPATKPEKEELQRIYDELKQKL
ncbi:unnamed protein product [Parajaminaea phylloscopi]